MGAIYYSMWLLYVWMHYTAVCGWYVYNIYMCGAILSPHTDHSLIHCLLEVAGCELTHV